MHSVTVQRHSAQPRRRFTGQEKGLLLPLRKITVVIGLAHQPGAHHQPGLAQQLSYLPRLPPAEVEGDRVTQRFRQVQQLVTGLERQQH